MSQVRILPPVLNTMDTKHLTVAQAGRQLGNQPGTTGRYIQAVRWWVSNLTMACLPIEHRGAL